MAWGTVALAQEPQGQPGLVPKAKAEEREKVDQLQVQGNREYDQRRQDTASKIVVTKERFNVMVTPI